MPRTSVTRYVITHVNRDGMRTLTRASLGRYTFGTPEEAQRVLDAFLANSEEVMVSVHGEQSRGTFAVRPVPCYPDHFDPQTIWFDD